MWRAAGADESRRPIDWPRRSEAGQFIEFLAGSLNVADCHLCQTEPGRGGGTWAHWQVGMAYAKYLSPEFHAWCNEVVRAHMEGRGLPELLGKTT
jgi:KilA-N domain